MSNKKYGNIVCCNIRYLRAKHHLSRTVMARKLHITVKTLDSLEAGIVPDRCSAMILFHIYDAFGIRPSISTGIRLEETDHTK